MANNVSGSLGTLFADAPDDVYKAKTYADAAANAAKASSTSETASASSASAAKKSETNAAASEASAKSSASAAKTSETNAASSATAAATSEKNAKASETSAADSAADAQTLATSCSTNATNAAASATSAENSKTFAASSAAAAANSADSAKTSETNAQTSALAAATSETNAANSATLSSNKADESAASAAAAKTSEGNASTSETNASTSETNAAASATAAAASAEEAKNTLANVVLRAGDTMDGDLTVPNLTATGDVTVSGSVTATTVYNAVYADYAEFFPRGGETQKGDIVALDTYAGKEQYIRATNKSECVVGVHSESFAHIIGGHPVKDGENVLQANIDDFIPVALAGRVYVRFIGPAVAGGYVVPSDIPGVGCLYGTGSKKNVVGTIVQADHMKDERLVKILVRGGL